MLRICGIQALSPTRIKGKKAKSHVVTSTMSNPFKKERKMKIFRNRTAYIYVCLFKQARGSKKLIFARATHCQTKNLPSSLFLINNKDFEA